MTLCKDNWLKKGCTGENVKTLQRLINNTKLFQIVVDGIFLEQTESALKSLQKLDWITIDGIAGDETQGQLKNWIPSLVRITNYTSDRQDNAWQCGPSALLMALSILGVKVNESFLASAAGTSVNGITSAVSMTNKTLKTNIKTRTAKKIPLATLASYIKSKIPVMVRLRSWIRPNGGQHWVTILAINLSNQTIRFADPSYGERITSLDDFKSRVEYVWSRGVTNPFVILTQG